MDVVQEVELLFSMHKTLGSISSLVKENKHTGRELCYGIFGKRDLTITSLASPTGGLRSSFRI